MNPMTSIAQTPRWTREQIRAARLAPLIPLLQQRGFPLIALDAGNFESANHPGLLIKDHYWRWPGQDKAGNTIDFLTHILGLTFNDAMRSIFPS